MSLRPEDLSFGVNCFVVSGLLSSTRPKTLPIYVPVRKLLRGQDHLELKSSSSGSQLLLLICIACSL